MENFEKCTVAMLGGPCSQHVTGNTSQLNQPQSAIILHTSLYWLGQNIDPSLNTWKKPHSLPWRVSYGLSFMRIFQKTDCVIMAPHCSLNIGPTQSTGWGEPNIFQGWCCCLTFPIPFLSLECVRLMVKFYSNCCIKAIYTSYSATLLSLVGLFQYLC